MNAESVFRSGRVLGLRQLEECQEIVGDEVPAFSLALCIDQRGRGVRKTADGTGSGRMAQHLDEESPSPIRGD